MHKLYCIQTDPALQVSPLEPYEEITEDLFLCGNREFNSHVESGYEAVFERYYSGAQTARALSILKGEKYTHKCIRGSWQSGWQNMYYPAAWGEAWANRFETEYFNEGTEWTVYTAYEDIQAHFAGDGFGERVYCTSWDNKRELAEHFEVEEDSIVLFMFDGYDQQARYREA